MGNRLVWSLGETGKVRYSTHQIRLFEFSGGFSSAGEAADALRHEMEEEKPDTLLE
jgi:hypothetical protein